MLSGQVCAYLISFFTTMVLASHPDHHSAPSSQTAKDYEQRKHAVLRYNLAASPTVDGSAFVMKSKPSDRFHRAVSPLISDDQSIIGNKKFIIFTRAMPFSYAGYMCRLQGMHLLTAQAASGRFNTIINTLKLNDDQSIIGNKKFIIFTRAMPFSYAGYMCRLQGMHLLTAQAASGRFNTIINTLKLNGTQSVVQFWLQGFPCQEQRWVRQQQSWGGSYYNQEDEKACKQLIYTQDGNHATFKLAKLPCKLYSYVGCYA